jgi:endonuclease/exonuclease/phosphatase family metal-dependent hydrolase
MPDLLFLQEAIEWRLDDLQDAYQVVRRAPETGKPRGRTSALLIRKGLGLVVDADPDILSHLGTYAAAAEIATSRGSITCVSVHASPSQVAVGEAPEALRQTRSCEVTPWWADVFIQDLLASPRDRLVIAGDLNEARRWDNEHGGHVCSAEFFASVAELGLVDITWRDWNKRERHTRRDPDYQLDHVFASTAIASDVEADAIEVVHDDASDHAAITFLVRA